MRRAAVLTAAVCSLAGTQAWLHVSYASVNTLPSHTARQRPLSVTQQGSVRRRSCIMAGQQPGDSQTTSEQKLSGFSRWQAALPQFSQTKQWLTSALAAVSIMVSLSGCTPPAMAAADATTNKEIGVCILSNCRKELGACLLNPKCLANLICIQTCTNKPNETECQIKCGDLFENEVVGKFNACAVSQKKCVPQKQDDGSYPVPPPEALVKQFDTSIFTGRWYISAGLNPIFDIFDCQVHFFVNPAPGQVYAKLNWRIKEPDGEFFNRNTVQQFVQQKDNPAILLNHNNEYLHYEDDWYILDAEPNSHVLIYYRGQNDAWKGYGGAVLYTREKTVPKALIPRLEAACERANIKWSSFKETDNSCKPESRDATLLREEYAKKLFLMEENALAQQLTAVRGFAADTIKFDEKGAEEALKALEKLREEYQTELSQEVQSIEKGLEKEIKQDLKEVEKEIETIERQIASSLNSKNWKQDNSGTLSSLEDKLK